MASDYYPETLGCYFIINAPSFFPFIWGIVKTFLDEKTRNSVKIFGVGEGYDQLKEIIDEENIPSYLGGKCTCSDSTGNCITSNKGPWLEYEAVKPFGIRKI